MKPIERRIKGLEKMVPVPECGHKMAYLIDPTEEEVEKVEKELNACPQCRRSRGGRGRLFVIFHNFRELEEKPKPQVQGFEFEVEAETAKNGNHKINFMTYL